MNDLLEASWRTSLILGVLLIITRVLGRRILAQLTFFDFAVGITIGNVAASVISDKTANIPSILASLVTATFWVLIISTASMKLLPARKILEDQPIVVVYKGRILVEKNLSKKHYNINDLLELLREQGIFSPSEVEVALIETDGALSVLKKPAYPEMNSSGSLNSMAFSNMVGKELIIDGKIIPENLSAAGMTNQELLEQLARQGIVRVESVMLGLLTPAGELYIDQKQDNVKHSLKRK
jgi:uncharacterized membrane protein YcaP (DUF421 family)